MPDMLMVCGVVFWMFECCNDSVVRTENVELVKSVVCVMMVEDTAGLSGRVKPLIYLLSPPRPSISASFHKQAGQAACRQWHHPRRFQQ